MEIRLSKLANKDLDDIYFYLLKDGNAIAVNQIMLIKRALDYLSVFSKMGKPLITLINCDKEYRMLTIKKTYVAVYYIENNKIIVSRIFRSEQDFIKKLDNF